LAMQIARRAPPGTAHLATAQRINSLE
jgi:hypothetical protein